MLQKPPHCTCGRAHYASFCGDSLLVAGNAALPMAGDLDFFYDQFCTTPGDACPSLPVEFAAFSGVAEGKVNRLEWTTATEEATAFHRVQRSADGLVWDQIGQLAAAGESNDYTDYRFLDEAPLPRALYRIVTQDIDGQTTTSSLVQISRDDFPEGLIINQLYPQPAGGSVLLRLASPNDAQVRLSIFDAGGRRLLEQFAPVNEGINELRLNLAALPAGIYSLVVSGSDGELAVRRLVRR